MAFLNPARDPHGVGFQLTQSFIAFGSGGLWGVGLGESRQKMFYLPEAHTDFIFSVVGEELGLAGGLLVLGLFGVIAARGLRTALRHPDAFAVSPRSGSRPRSCSRRSSMLESSSGACRRRGWRCRSSPTAGRR